jgi:uncharacterized protein HemX
VVTVTEIVSSFSQFGWAVTLLALVLIGVGAALGLFFKAYLKRQDREFEAREEERKNFKEERDADRVRFQEERQQFKKASQEEQEFIRSLVKQNTESQMQSSQTMAEMTQILATISETIRTHHQNTLGAITTLRDEHSTIIRNVEMKQ